MEVPTAPGPYSRAPRAPFLSFFSRLAAKRAQLQQRQPRQAKPAGEARPEFKSPNPIPPPHRAPAEFERGHISWRHVSHTTKGTLMEPGISALPRARVFLVTVRFAILLRLSSLQFDVPSCPPARVGRFLHLVYFVFPRAYWFREINVHSCCP